MCIIERTFPPSFFQVGIDLVKMKKLGKISRLQRVGKDLICLLDLWMNRKMWDMMMVEGNVLLGARMNNSVNVLGEICNYTTFNHNKQKLWGDN